MPVTATELGSPDFRADHETRYAYAAGSMYRGIASPDLVVAMARRGLLAFLGTGGMPPAEVVDALSSIRARLSPTASFGANLLHTPADPAAEQAMAALLVEKDVRRIEASAFMDVTPAIAHFRLSGLRRLPDGEVVAKRHVIAKLSHASVARQFMAPVPGRMAGELAARGLISESERDLAPFLPVAQDVCVESDSGGHTSQGVALALLPAIRALRDEAMAMHCYRRQIRVGAAGGIGTPEAAAACFFLGADFLTTGSVNQCTVEAGTSEAVKDLLAAMGPNDTAYAPAGDMFEIGARVQVLKSGTLFPVRANRLREIYQRFERIEDLDEPIRTMLERQYFRRSLDEIWAEAKARQVAKGMDGEALEADGKRKMALIFRWYFARSNRFAIEGDVSGRSDFQIHCGPALGSFNAWAAGGPLADWRARQVHLVAEAIMEGAADVTGRRISAFTGRSANSQLRVDAA